MPAERDLVNVGVVEVLRGIAGHPDPPHYRRERRFMAFVVDVYSNDPGLDGRYS
jgi:hypothetical protein